ncbi:CaiB/BaiF CoA transferase family protein [Parachitinimonas caeni]|uniref:CaiB/BaiF CoA-transferase family protein n=1 Tax=Parachitinimonas caeni TaxID=3031301 RepID=A0ABT7DRY2_9NEIS|nr:CaiB/BaiF CoA-transferase family protein [Parachitinimonas caeni]MDK2122825.1 CaiB/BaiF CoA-transferase family protein [Parachitinimonas caeni]
MGPLKGIRVVEFAGVGPAPYCGMLLADLGADVTIIERPGGDPASRALGFTEPRANVLNRGKRSLALDLKQPAGLAVARRLLAQADALIEGYRPGVMERLGLGPEPCLAANPRLIYGRMTGWGQTGPLAQAAGHDLNFVALSGALGLSRRAEGAPTVPATVVGDMGGGGLFLAFGLVCALLEARHSGLGQVIDAAVVDGSASLTSLIWALKASGGWSNAPAPHVFRYDSPFYDCFACADGKWISLGPIEPPFYQLLLEKLELTSAVTGKQFDASNWPALKATIARRIAERSQAEWCRRLEGSDVCFAPVLDLDELPQHPQHQARQSFIEVAGHTQPAPAPRFSRTAAAPPSAPPRPGEHGTAILLDYGYDEAEIAALTASGVVG